MAPRLSDEPSATESLSSAVPPFVPVDSPHSFGIYPTRQEALLLQGSTDPSDEALISGIQEVGEFRGFRIPSHLELIGGLSLETVLTGALTEWSLQQIPSLSRDSAPEEERSRFAIVQSFRHALEKAFLGEWKRKRDLRQRQAASAEMAKVVLEHTRASAEIGPYLLFPNHFTWDDMRSIQRHMQSQPVPYVPSIEPGDSQRSGIKEILQWRHLSPECEGKVYRMEYENESGEAKSLALVVASEAYIANERLIDRFIKTIVMTTATREVEVLPLRMIRLEGRHFYAFSHEFRPEKLLAFHKRIHQEKISLLREDFDQRCREGTVNPSKPPPESLEDKLPFALKELKDSRGRGLGVFRGVSLKLEEGQSFHHVLQFIWIGNGLSEDYLSERIAELNRLEPFYKRQGRDRVRVEKFSEGLAVAFPPYYSLEALVHFKVTLDIHLGRK